MFSDFDYFEKTFIFFQIVFNVDNDNQFIYKYRLQKILIILEDCKDCIFIESLFFDDEDFLRLGLIKLEVK